MVKEHFVVIGNGPAGNQAALTLSQKEPQARVTLVSRERTLFCKPYLLPDFIAGKIVEKEVYGPQSSQWDQQNFKLRSGQEVVGINTEKKEITLGHKEILSYSGLIIAVGSRPYIPEYLHAYRGFLHTLKTVLDARTWISELKEVDSVLIIGGDLTSFSMTKALLHLHKKVYFMLNEDAFWPLRFNREMGEEVTQKLKQMGVEVLESRNIQNISLLSDNNYEFHWDNKKIKVGHIGAFFGHDPDTRFLVQGNLQIDRGILVDEYLNTGVEGIFATGDCAQIYHPEIKDYWISIGHENAMELGKISALNLLGGRIKKEIPKESIFKLGDINVNTSWWRDF
jgi:nitrite reductase (NADH) large subunit